MKIKVPLFSVMALLTAVLDADTTTTPIANFGAASITVAQSSGEARIPVNINGPPLRDFFGTRVSMRSVDGTATWPESYDSIYHSLQFSTPERTKTLVIGIPAAPAFEGTRMFSVRMDSGSSYDIGSPSSISVNITGSLAPEISVEHPAGTALANGTEQVNFGDVAVGGPPSSRVITIRNTGTGTLTGLAVSLVNANASPFTITQPVTTTIPPGGFKSFSVAFKPLSAGTFSAPIQIVSNDMDEPTFYINTSGTGITAPEITVEQPAGSPLTDNIGALNFRSSLVGASGESKTIVIRNSGTATLSGLGISVNGSNTGDFLISQLGVNSLEPGSSTQVTVTFNPTDSGGRSATIQVASNDSDENPFDIKVTGSAPFPLPEIEVTQPKSSILKDGRSKKSFGTAKIGKTGKIKKFTIKTIGTANLTGIAITKKGVKAKDFIITQPARTVLVPGASTTFKVTFKPRGTGRRNSVFLIKSNDSDENPFAVKVSGKGAAKKAK